jgi:type II secretory pathway pseudopilin PulG
MYNHQKGMSLTELMIALTISMILSIGVLYIYAGQVRTFFQVARKEHTTLEAQSAFEVVAGLVRQAEMCLIVGPACPTLKGIAITYPAGVANPNASVQLTNDSIQIDFSVPSGYSIWPNNTPPYTNNAMRVSWSVATNIVQLSAGATAGAGSVLDIAGASGNLNTKIVNLDLWPMVVDAAGAVTPGAAVTDKATAGYRLVMTARVGTPDITYTNPLDPNGPLKNYRTVTYERIILPRNW